MNLVQIQEELSQRHIIEATNYEISKHQAKAYEVRFYFKFKKKWRHIKQELSLLNYACQYLKQEIHEMENQDTNKEKCKEEETKKEIEKIEDNFDLTLKNRFRTLADYSLISKYELSLETGFDLISNFHSPKKVGLVVRYMRFDPLMESSSQVYDITRKEQQSYFINFEINRETLVFELFLECCRMWNLNEQSAILTDEYFNIISKEALAYASVCLLFKRQYRFLNEEKIQIIYIFENIERVQTHVKRIQKHLIDFDQEKDFTLFNENLDSEKFKQKVKNIYKTNRGIGIYEGADEWQIENMKKRRKCGRGQFILSPFGLASIILLFLIMMMVYGLNHTSIKEYWIKKAIQEILQGGQNPASKITTVQQFYYHQIQKHQYIRTTSQNSNFEIVKFEIYSIVESQSSCSRNSICFGLNGPANTQAKTIHRDTDSYTLYNSGSTRQYDFINSIQKFQANFYESIPGSQFQKPAHDIPLLMEAYQRSEYIDTDTRFVVIQVYFKYEQNANYTGIGQEVYQVRGLHSLFLRSIDSSVFQPDLLENQASKPSYIIYSIALFFIIFGSFFFLVLNVIQICKLRRAAAAAKKTLCQSKVWSKIRSVFYKAVVIVLCSLHFSDLSSLSKDYIDLLEGKDDYWIELNFSYQAIYSFISLAILALFLLSFKYSRLSFKCFLNFKAFVESLPSIFLIYVTAVLFFLCFSLLTSFSGNPTIHNCWILFLNEFQMKKSPSIQVESRSESQLFLLIPLYLFGMIVLFTSMPFAFILETKRKFYKFQDSGKQPTILCRTQCKAWLCNWRKVRKVKPQN